MGGTTEPPRLPHKAAWVEGLEKQGKEELETHGWEEPPGRHEPHLPWASLEVLGQSWGTQTEGESQSGRCGPWPWGLVAQNRHQWFHEKVLSEGNKVPAPWLERPRNGLWMVPIRNANIQNIPRYLWCKDQPDAGWEMQNTKADPKIVSEELLRKDSQLLQRNDGGHNNGKK